MESPKVAIVMGSDSDLPTMQVAMDFLIEFGVAYEARVISAHRAPVQMATYAQEAEARGIVVLIAGAGGSAHLPGMLAAHTILPVIGVPVSATPLYGMDALLSIVQMPAGVPVATVAIGGARNAAILAAQILARQDNELAGRLHAYKQQMSQEVCRKDKWLVARETGGLFVPQPPD